MPITTQADAPPDLMTLDDMCVFFGGTKPLSRRSIYNGMKDGRFPQSIKIGKFTTRWRRSDCVDALARLEKASQ